MSRFLRASAVASLSILVLSCGEPPATPDPAASAASWNKVTGDLNLSLRAANNLDGIQIPIIKSSTLDDVISSRIDVNAA